jgi:ribosomal protein S18 acetylase RimI-like enzyme
MITLEPIHDPGNPSIIEIQKSIMNSHPSFNLIVVGKESLTNEEIIEENKKNLASGEIMLLIKDDNKYIGIATYLPMNPHDNHTWIGLLIIHKEHERKGIGSITLKLLEQKLMEQKVEKVRLCVQNGNDNRASFWKRNGFVKISSSTDKHNNHIDIYEKSLKYDNLNITYIVDDKEMSTDAFLTLVQQVWPGLYNEDMTRDALLKTINITAWDDQKLVGCSRLLTDGYLFGTITEILVAPDYQKKNIGKSLMDLTWECSPTSLFIGAQQGNEEFFEKLGFTKSIQSYQRKKPRK